MICDPPTRAKLESLGELVIHESSRMPDEMVERYLPEAVIIMGQTKLPRERLIKAKKLRAIIDVETNFTDAIDYDYCFANGIHVLTPGSAFADVVAESALGMAIDLARGITGPTGSSGRAARPTASMPTSTASVCSGRAWG